MSNFLKSLKVKGIEIDPAGAVTGNVLKYDGTKFGAASVGALDDLSDVVITSPVTTQFVRYNGTNFVNATISAGDVPTLNQNTTGTAATVTGAAQTAITSVGTLTALSVTGTATVRAAATQDGIALTGRAGGTSSWKVTLTPTTLSADQTLTLPNASGTVITTGNLTSITTLGTVTSGTIDGGSA